MNSFLLFVYSKYENNVMIAIRTKDLVLFQTELNRYKKLNLESNQRVQDKRFVDYFILLE